MNLSGETGLAKCEQLEGHLESLQSSERGIDPCMNNLFTESVES